MNAINQQTAASASFAFANVARAQVLVNGVYAAVSRLKHKWLSLHAWTMASIDSITTPICSAVMDSPVGFPCGSGLRGRVPVALVVAVRPTDVRGVRSADRREFRRLVSNR